MRVYKTLCDRCKKEISDSERIELYGNRFFLRWEKDCSYEKVEICKDCFNSFKNWLKMEGENEGTLRKEF